MDFANRREFLALTIAGAAAAAVPTSLIASPRDWLRELADPDLLRAVPARSMLCEIGRAYCEKFPSESEIDRLVGKLLADPSVDVGGVKASLDRRSQVDFAEGQVVQVSGWILSRTEARQCALYSLITSLS